MTRLLGNLLLVLVIATAVLYLGDWVVWKVRGGDAGNGMGSVEVTRVIVAPLKGGKEEYYPDGTGAVGCSQSLFPWAGAGPCWWVERHRTARE